MSFVPMSDLLARAYREGYAVPAFTAWNAETMAAILAAAERLRAPVILMQGPLEFALLPPHAMADVARAVMRHSNATAALHLDHGDSLEMVNECLDAGYTSVMLDYSARPFEENAAALRSVCERAHPRGIPVEGEIGHVGKAESAAAEGAGASALTDAAEAVEYLRRTRVDFLAVSIGNAHGFYTGDPRLDFGLLEELRSAIDVPLVLHGGTGIPESDIRRAVGMGISKVNVASELIRAVRQSLTAQWADGRNHWTPSALAEAAEAVGSVVEKWVRITGAEGKAL